MWLDGHSVFVVCPRTPTASWAMEQEKFPDILTRNQTEFLHITFNRVLKIRPKELDMRSSKISPRILWVSAQ